MLAWRHSEIDRGSKFWMMMMMMMMMMVVMMMMIMMMIMMMMMMMMMMVAVAVTSTVRHECQCCQDSGVPKETSSGEMQWPGTAQVPLLRDI